MRTTPLTQQKLNQPKIKFIVLYFFQTQSSILFYTHIRKNGMTWFKKKQKIVHYFWLLLFLDGWLNSSDIFIIWNSVYMYYCSNFVKEMLMWKKLLTYNGALWAPSFIWDSIPVQRLHQGISLAENILGWEIYHLNIS